jgi:hypothetical protein
MVVCYQRRAVETAMASFERMRQVSDTAVRHLRVRSALNPALWLSAIATPGCLTGAYWFKGVPWIRGVLVVVGLIPIVTASAIYIYFALTKPEKLQSEEYQLRHETLRLIEVKARISPIDGEAIQAIASAPLHRLTPGEDTSL